MNDQPQGDGDTTPPALTVTPEVLEAGKALLRKIDRYQYLEQPELASTHADLRKAKHRAYEALYDFRQVVAADNPHLDYAKIPMYNPSDFDSKRWRMRVDAVDPINSLLTKIATDEGLPDPERFAVFSTKNKQFQI